MQLHLWSDGHVTLISKLKFRAQTRTTLANTPSFEPLIDTCRTFAAEALVLHRQSVQRPHDNFEFIH